VLGGILSKGKGAPFGEVYDESHLNALFAHRFVTISLDGQPVGSQFHPSSRTTSPTHVWTVPVKKEASVSSINNRLLTFGETSQPDVIVKIVTG